MRRRRAQTPLDATKTRTPGGGSWLILGANYDQREVVHPLVAAGTGSGKTVTVARPPMYDVQVNRPQNLVIADLKGQELPALKRMAAVRDYYHYSFEESSPTTSSLNPIASPVLADAFFSSLLINPHAKETYWQDSALEMALAVAEAINYESLATMYDTIRSAEKLDELAETNDEVRITWAEQDERQRESFRGEIRSRLAPLRHPHIRRLFSPGAEEPPFTGQSVLVVIQPPMDEDTQQAWSALMAATAGHIWRRSLAGYDGGGPGTFWIMDEAPVTTDLPRLRNWITTGRGKGQKIMPIVQNIGQIDAKIGHDARRDLLGSCDLHIYGKTGDQESAEAVARASGKVYRNRSVRQDADKGSLTRWINDARGTTETSIREVEETRVSPDTITGLPTGSFVLMQGSREGTQIVDGTSIEDYEHILAERNVYPPENARQLGMAPQAPQAPQAPAATPGPPQPQPQPQAEPEPEPSWYDPKEPEHQDEALINQMLTDAYPQTAPPQEPQESQEPHQRRAQLYSATCANCGEENQQPGGDCANCGEIVR